jgi:hypothetical protein
MAGNVAEWTSNAFDESAYTFGHDLNMDYSYEAKDTDPPALKRKVIRGGSWKDISYYLHVGTRTYEFQDTAKSFIGFRCVQTYLGRMAGDGPNASAVYLIYYGILKQAFVLRFRGNPAKPFCQCSIFKIESIN